MKAEIGDSKTIKSYIVQQECNNAQQTPQPQKNRKIQRLKTGMAMETSRVRFFGALLSSEVFKRASQRRLKFSCALKLSD